MADDLVAPPSRRYRTSHDILHWPVVGKKIGIGRDETPGKAPPPVSGKGQGLEEDLGQHDGRSDIEVYAAFKDTFGRKGATGSGSNIESKYIGGTRPPQSNFGKLVISRYRIPLKIKKVELTMGTADFDR